MDPQIVYSKDKIDYLVCVRFENAHGIRVGPFPAPNVAWNEIKNKNVKKIILLHVFQMYQLES